MEDFVISCCSTSDLNKSHYLSRDIKYACFHYYLNGKEYSDDFGESVSFPDFYKAMKEGADTRTSQINVEEFIIFFESFLAAGKDIIHVTLSSGISGVINSASIAADILKDKYPQRKIYIVDSLGASAGYGLLIDKLADLRDQGKSIDEIKEFTEKERLKLNHWFFSTDLSFYVKGGRISKTSGFIGTILEICPLLNMDNLGRLIPRFKIRSKRKVIVEIVNKMIENAEDGIEYHGKCYISHSNCIDDAQKVAKLVEEKFKKLDGKVEIYDVGTTIGSHTGPGTVALFFWGKERIN